MSSFAIAGVLQFSESGDMAVDLAPIFDFSSASLPYCDSQDMDCLIDIDVASGPGGVTGHLNIASREDIYNIRLNFAGLTFSGTTSSDAVMPGCGEFAACFVTGQLVSGGEVVPEPPSLAMLLAGLAAIGGAIYLGRKKAITA